LLNNTKKHVTSAASSTTETDESEGDGTQQKIEELQNILRLKESFFGGPLLKRSSLKAKSASDIVTQTGRDESAVR